MPEILSNLNYQKSIVENLIDCINFPINQNVCSSFHNIGVANGYDNENYRLLLNEYHIPLKKIAINYFLTFKDSIKNIETETFFINLQKSNIEEITHLQIAEKLLQHDKRNLSQQNSLQAIMLRDHYLFCQLIKTILKKKLTKKQNTQGKKFIIDKINNVQYYRNNYNQELFIYACLIDILCLCYVENIRDFLPDIDIEILINLNNCIDSLLYFIENIRQKDNSSIKMLSINIGNIKTLQNTVNETIIDIRKKTIYIYQNLYDTKNHCILFSEISNIKTQIENSVDTNNIQFTILVTKFLSVYNYFLNNLLQFKLNVTSDEKDLKNAFCTFLNKFKNVSKATQEVKQIIDTFIHLIIIEYGIADCNCFLKNLSKEYTIINKYAETSVNNNRYSIHEFVNLLDNYSISSFSTDTKRKKCNIREIFNNYLTSFYNALDYGRSRVCKQDCLTTMSVIYRSSNVDRNIMKYPTDTNGLFLWLSSKNYRLIYQASDIWNLSQKDLIKDNFITAYDIENLQSEFIDFNDTITGQIYNLCNLWEFSNNLFIYSTINKRKNNQDLALQLYQFSAKEIYNLISIYTDKNKGIESLLIKNIFFDIACYCQYNSCFVDQINCLILENTREVNEKFHNNIIESIQIRTKINQILQNKNLDLQKTIEKAEDLVRNTISILNFLEIFNSQGPQEIEKKDLQQISLFCNDIISNCTENIRNNISEFLRIVKLEIPGELIKLLYETQKEDSFLQTLKKEILIIQKNLQPNIFSYLSLQFIEIKSRTYNKSNYIQHRKNCIYNEDNVMFHSSYNTTIKTLIDSFLNNIITFINSLQCGYFNLYEKDILELSEKIICTNSNYLDFKNLMEKILHIRKNVENSDLYQENLESFLNEFCKKNFLLFQEKLKKIKFVKTQNSFENIANQIFAQEGLITFISHRIRNLNIEAMSFPIFQLRQYIHKLEDKDEISIDRANFLQNTAKQNCRHYFLPLALESEQYSVYFSFHESIKQLKEILNFMAQIYIVNTDMVYPKTNKIASKILKDIKKQKLESVKSQNNLQKNQIIKQAFETQNLSAEALKFHINSFNSSTDVFKITKTKPKKEQILKTAHNKIKIIQEEINYSDIYSYVNQCNENFYKYNYFYLEKQKQQKDKKPIYYQKILSTNQKRLLQQHKNVKTKNELIFNKFTSDKKTSRNSVINDLSNAKISKNNRISSFNTRNKSYIINNNQEYNSKIYNIKSYIDKSDRNIAINRKKNRIFQKNILNNKIYNIPKYNYYKNIKDKKNTNYLDTVVNNNKNSYYIHENLHKPKILKKNIQNLHNENNNILKNKYQNLNKNNFVNTNYMNKDLNTNQNVETLDNYNKQQITNNSNQNNSYNYIENLHVIIKSPTVIIIFILVLFIIFFKFVKKYVLFLLNTNNKYINSINSFINKLFHKFYFS